MSVIKCGAVGCAHNSDCSCARRHIEVCVSGGDCRTVFCGTYKPRRREEISNLKNEIGKIDLCVCRDTGIACDAAGCVHNKDGVCTADTVHISQPETAKRRKCPCDSFEQ